MAHIKFKFDTLNAFCNEAFEKFGFSKEEKMCIRDSYNSFGNIICLFYE